MYCQKCGAKINDGAKFCTSCGVEQNVPPVAVKKGGNLKFFLGPVVLLFVILMLWGLVNVFHQTFGGGESAIFNFIKILMPIIIMVLVVLIPIGIVVGLVRTYSK